MEDRLFTYLWRHSRAEQYRVMLVVFLSLPFYYLLLDLPKLIVNGPIQGKGVRGRQRHLFRHHPSRLAIGRNPF